MDNGYIESFNNRLRKDCLNRNYLEHPVRGSVADCDLHQSVTYVLLSRVLH